MTDYKKYINALRKCAKEHENGRTFTGHIIVADLCRDTANLLEDLEQEPKTGHWIMSEDGLYRPICDKCGAHPWKGYIPTVEEATEVFKYCPNCGAKMVASQESEVDE